MLQDRRAESGRHLILAVVHVALRHGARPTSIWPLFQSQIRCIQVKDNRVGAARTRQDTIALPLDQGTHFYRVPLIVGLRSASGTTRVGVRIDNARSHNPHTKASAGKDCSSEQLLAQPGQLLGSLHSGWLHPPPRRCSTQYRTQSNPVTQRERNSKRRDKHSCADWSASVTDIGQRIETGPQRRRSRR